MNNIKQLPRLMVFTIVAQKKSFTKAAKHLQISKSAVSQHVTQLEKELGVRLLNRTTRTISLTAIGSTLLERCTVLQDQLSLTFNELNNAGVNPQGRFAVTYPHSIETAIVFPTIEQLCREFPNLKPVLVAEDSCLDLVENQLDIAIRVGKLADSEYRALQVGSLTEIFCATPFYLDIHGEISSTEDLSRHPWISTSWQRSQTTIFNSMSGEHESVVLNQFANANTLPGIVGLALRNLGIVLVPNLFAGPLLQSGQLVHIAKGITGPDWQVHTVHAYQNDKPTHISRFQQLVSRRFENTETTLGRR